MRPLKQFRSQGGDVTLIPLRFAPRQSFFIVLRGPASNQPGDGVNIPKMKVICPIRGPWQVSFDPRWGGPVEAVSLAQLMDWTQRPEPGIKYYSGTATYKKAFEISQSEILNLKSEIYLDLGRVRNVAEVRLNGRNLGVVWTAPWRVDATKAIKPGVNTLEIEVVNLWPNRLIGDAGQPKEKRLTVTNVKKFDKPGMALLESGLLGPVSVLAEE
jgi:hypothetical protein